jgi:hypothetical protein
MIGSMTEAVDSYVRAFDEAGDYALDQAVRLKQAELEDIDELLRNSEMRDAELWEEIEVADETTIQEYEVDEDRDLDWIMGFGGMGAAAVTQFVLQNAEPLIFKPVAYRIQVMEPFEDLSQTQMVAAGKRGTIGFNVQAVTQFQKLSARFLDTMERFRAMEPVDLYRSLRSMGALPAIEKTTADAIGYVSRMTNYAAGSQQFKAAVNNLIDSLSSRAVIGQSRRAIERIYTERAVGGDSSRLMVWICEGAKNTCEYCRARSGEIKTYEQWVVDGLPGADVCAGQDLCKCGLDAA